MAEKLEEYQLKRDFRRTREPKGQIKAGARDDVQGALYVMHWHHASHEHFDLRLEQDGVLRSWALPKGPSLKPGEKCLAVEVEPHPIEYGDFEGVIPEGEYGAGPSMLWDKGRWILKKTARDGELDFELQGEKLKGRWTLVRTGKKGKRQQWLMIKRSDREGQISRIDDRSVVSGRNMEEIARDRDRIWAGTAELRASRDELQPGRYRHSRKAALPETLDPQLAKLAQRVPIGESWIHEIKFDGYRVLARFDQGQVRLFTRNRKDWSHRFPEIVATLSALPFREAFLDGEVVALTEGGISDFGKLQDVLSAGPPRTGMLVYQLFDLLFLNGYDLTGLAVSDRKALLKHLLEYAGVHGQGRLRYVDHFEGRGPEVFTQVCELGLEGIISKQAQAPYHHDRHSSWRKTKCTAQDEFLVGGYTPAAGARKGFRSLLLGQWTDEGLAYSGRVGSGFGQRALADLKQRLDKLSTSKRPFCHSVPKSEGVEWVRPELVVDVEFSETTSSGVLRHPVYRGVREDRDPGEIKVPGEAEEVQSGASTRAALDTESAANPGAVANITVSHPERLIDPDSGATKLALARYYESIHHWVLPYLAYRPLSLLRCPEGLAGECFFQKHPVSSLMKRLPRKAIREKSTTRDYVYVRTAADLIELVQAGVLEIHPWGALVEDVDHPDIVVFDLDPGPGVPWKGVIDTAKSLRERLSAMGFTAFVRTTGGKGLHLVVPLEPCADWGQVKGFARAVSRAHADDSPSHLTVNMAKKRRQGRIFIDYLRNGRGNTAIGAYSTRARPQLPVATPLRWAELTTRVTADHYHIRNLPRRLAALKSDPWEGFLEARRPLERDLLKRLNVE